ncbi:MAG: hypothetical protein ACE5J5_01985 [Candidatus Hydrothermarchaeales archaeon]
MIKLEWKKGLISGVIAGILMLVVGSVLMIAGGATEWYSLTFPTTMSSPGGMYSMTVSVLVMGIIMGMIYSVINSAIPGEGTRKGVNYGIMVWLLAGLMWPIMMLGFAPVSIVIIEMITGLINYSVAGAVLVVIYEKV